MKKPKITVDDVMETVESLEHTNDWMLEMFKNPELMAKDPDRTEFAKIYKGAICQAVVANVFRSLLSKESNRNQLIKQIELVEGVYTDFDEYWEKTEA